MTVNQERWSNRHDGQTQYDSTIGEEGKKNYQRPEEFTQLSVSPQMSGRIQRTRITWPPWTPY